MGAGVGDVRDVGALRRCPPTGLAQADRAASLGLSKRAHVRAVTCAIAATGGAWLGLRRDGTQGDVEDALPCGCKHTKNPLLPARFLFRVIYTTMLCFPA